MFIDIHVHTRRVPGLPRDGKPAYATPEQLVERFDAVGVERAVLLPSVSPECTRTPQHPGRIRAVNRGDRRPVFSGRAPIRLSPSHTGC